MAEKPLTLLQKLQNAARARKLEQNSKESVEWFKNNARKAIGKTSGQNALLKQQPKAKNVGKRSPIGKMFCFVYDPKHKKTLPYYDRFPLGFYVGPARGGWFLLNLHYLPPIYRAKFFDTLLAIQTNPFNTEDKKLKLTYNLLVSSQRYYLFKPCFKRYLINHLESKVVEIAPDEWEAALFLPVADFKKASQSAVWSDSMLMARGKK